MKNSDYLKVQQMADRLIHFIKWKGATFESKEKKVIKEICLIKEFCYGCLDKENPDSFERRNKG